MRFGYIDEFPVSTAHEATAEEVRPAFDRERMPWDCRSG